MISASYEDIKQQLQEQSKTRFRFKKCRHTESDSDDDRVLDDDEEKKQQAAQKVHYDYILVI